MAVQFGRWSVEQKPLSHDYLEKVSALVAPYGSEAARSYSNGGLDMIYCGFPTTKESCAESQPHPANTSVMLTWDGRLDNREQLLDDLDGVSTASTDASIVAAAYARWGSRCFARLIGDWATAIWDPNTRSVLLARDFIGTRPLYYTCTDGAITWSTVLDPLVLLAGKPLELEEEYLAGWLASFPDAHLTPYVGILAVPPASFVEWKREKTTVHTYWDFDPRKIIRYSSDDEYQEHFRTLFSQSVRRRLRSNKSILAELSGGMDSGSIVCMADAILRDGPNQLPSVETISYYNDSEPNWNERPYFTLIEEARGRAGFHVEMNWSGLFDPDVGTRFYATPAALAMPANIEAQLGRHMTSRGFRVLLSGFGGDEVLGGVPTPVPELADLLAEARFACFARRLRLWALSNRKPLLGVASEVLRAFLPSCLSLGSASGFHPRWLNDKFVKRQKAAFDGYSKRLILLGPRPSFLENLNAFHALRRQIACFPLPASPAYEKRYPYLDRDLLEFLYAVPREQLIRPGERRSLMRRSLRGVVPPEVLARRRKSYVSRAPHIAFSDAWNRSVSAGERLSTDAFGIADHSRLQAALKRAKDGDGLGVVSLMRMLLLEMWLGRLPIAHLPGHQDQAVRNNQEHFAT